MNLSILVADKTEGEKTLTIEEEKILIQKAQLWDEKAVEEIIRLNINYIKLIIKKYYQNIKNGLEFEDLLNAWIEWILIAIKKYDLEVETKFITYATHYIYRMIINATMESQKIILPNRVRNSLNDIKRFQREFEKEFLYNPSHEDISLWVNISLAKVNEILQNTSFTFMNLDESVFSDNENFSLHGVISDSEQFSIEEQIYKKELQKIISKIFSNLDVSDREKHILYLRYFSNSKNLEKLTTIWKQFDITWERVRQILAKIMKELKNYIKKNNLEDLKDLLY